MFRFSIRDVLWLTVVVGLAVAWWIERRSLLQRLDESKYQTRLAKDSLELRWAEVEFYRRKSEATEAAGTADPNP